MGWIFSALYFRSLSSETEIVVLGVVVVVVTAGFFKVSFGNVGTTTVDSKASALRFRFKLVSVVNKDELVELNDESNVLFVGNFAVERNDDDNVDGGVLNRVDESDGLAEEWNKFDDDKRLGCLFVFVPAKSELVVFSVDDDDKRLEFGNNELLVRVVFFVVKIEFVVDNNEDAVDGFFESAIWLIAQYCIILVNIYKWNVRMRMTRVFKGKFLMQCQIGAITMLHKAQERRINKNEGHYSQLRK